MNKNKKPSNKKYKYFAVFVYGHLLIPSLRTAAESRLTGHPWLNVEFIPYL